MTGTRESARDGILSPVPDIDDGIEGMQTMSLTPSVYRNPSLPPHRARRGWEDDARRGVAVLGYVRVSTEEQASSGAGLAAQRAAIEAEAERRGWLLAEVVEDAGFSGKDLHRPGITAVMEALRSGDASVLMVAKLDRLSRSMLDLARIIDRSGREGWALVALDLGMDTSTPAGEALVHVMATFAQLERRLIGQRTREAMAMKRAQGIQIGRERAVPDKVVERIKGLRRQGLSLRAIGEVLDAEGVPTGHGAARWHGATIRDLLKSRMSEEDRIALEVSGGHRRWRKRGPRKRSPDGSAVRSRGPPGRAVPGGS